MVSAGVKQRAKQYRHEFLTASPFPHVVIDGFFEDSAAEQLVADFPPFDPANALNEFGEVGRKATIADIRKISAFYAQTYDYIASPEFLGLVSEITGIPDLVHDEQMFGGGTHENLEGQELDPHVDFNYIDARKLHRRLNVLVYLNREWQESWGGCLEIHSNPRRPKEDQIKIIPPALNRCVIFETSERSWHGFERIRLPADKKNVSRKLLSIYLYTRERPAEEVVPSHGTFYVQRPLPKHIVSGCTLTDEDIQEIHTLLDRRDGWIEYYQKKELESGQILEQVTKYLQEVLNCVRLPVTGFALQEGVVTGAWPDMWLGSPFEVSLRLQEPAESLMIRGEVPANFAQGMDVEIKVGAAASRHHISSGSFVLEIPARGGVDELLKLEIRADTLYCPADAGENADPRKLLLRLKELQVRPLRKSGVRSLLGSVLKV